ncbi:S-layer family protein [Nitrosospira sp. NpAV]|uniref:beta strand repeat-containing protein n=1 Tax=Nitrosospira sp. NpAV TaxID=58133 RepID=UPI00059EF1ED|nr:type I secretion C-terminal target domain-containing protein [Nitrosospira sp. NpAV]KIO48291.1 hypothetical protein SQ11_12525 [Nitrosospira sp. NpAV]
MTYVLTTNQRAVIQTLVDNEDWSTAYFTLGEILDVPVGNNDIDVGVQWWIQIAGDINSDSGGWASVLVRENTKRAGNGTITDQDFQDASDKIANDFFDMLLNPPPGTTAGTIPTIEQIIENDVVGAVNELGLEDEDWAGTLLASALFGYPAVENFIDSPADVVEQALRGLLTLEDGLGLLDRVEPLLNPILGLLGRTPSGGSGIGGGVEPLVFDLDASGTIDLLSTDDGVHFDFGVDSFAEKVGWAASTDGMLAIDLDSSGSINTGAELFGSEVPLSYITNANWDQFINEENGFAKLARYDLVANGGNGDGAITSADAVWSDLIMWQDANSDGISQSGEMLTLTSLGITSIDVSNYELESFNGLSSGTPFSRIIEGNTVTHTGSFTMNGNAYEVADVWFNSQLINTVYTEDYELDVRVLFLPTAHGYGMLPDLHVAMSINENLLDDMAGFVTGNDFGDLFGTTAQVDAENIMLGWAGIDPDNLAVDHSKLGFYGHMKEYQFLRSFTGQNADAYGVWFDLKPWVPYEYDGLTAVNEAYKNVLDAFTARLLFQSGGEALFDSGVSYNPYTDEFEGVFALSENAITDLETAASLSGNLAEYWRGVANFIEHTMGISELSGTEIGWLDDAIDGSSSGALEWTDITALLADPIAVTGTSGNDTISGTIHDDILGTTSSTGPYYSGTDGNDTLSGGAGNDVVYGGYGDDTLDGGEGNDILDGGYGNDTYIYNYGNDVIITAGSSTPSIETDIILMDAGILESDVTIHYEYMNQFQVNLFLEIEGRGTITIAVIDTNGYGPYASYVDEIHFASSAVWTMGQAPVYFHGTDALDGINSTGFEGNNIITGYNGDDIIQAGSGDDTLDGSGGNDDLRGEAGNDIYIVSAGGDVIRETGNDAGDIIMLPDGFDLGDVTFYKVEAGGTYGMYDDMKVDVEGLGSFTILNSFGWSGTTGNVEILKEFAGTQINLLSQVFTTIGTSGNDYFQGTSNYWGQPNDVYLFGTGQDEVYEYGGTDTLLFGEGVLPGAITASRIAGNNFADLQFSDGSGNTITFLNHFGSSATASALENVRFANGTIWTIANMEIQTLGTNSGENIFAYAWGDASQNDTIFAYGGADQVQGDAGNDYIDGGDGNDNLDGGSDNDTLSYSTAGAAVTVNLATTAAQNTGGSGTDTISNFENLIGSSYNDTLTGDGNANIIEGGAGNDTMNGAGGTDTLSYERAGAGITINLATATAQNTGGAGTDTISSFENLRGSAFNDTLTGTSGNNVIEGGAGNDTMNAQGGTDTLTYANAAAGITVSLALATAQSTGGAGSDTISNFENLTGSNFNDVLTGSTAANIIDGGDGNDIIQGGAGNDTLTGGNGIDTVSYASAASAVTFNLATTTSQNTVGAGSDTVSGFENIRGSAFNDTLTGNNSDNIIEGGAGNDTINGSGGTDTLSYVNASSAVTVNLSTATAQNTVGAGTDTISNFESLTGSNYGDTLTGSTAANIIRGGAGADTISGGNGNDILYGDAGADTLTGGSNADTFIFEALTALGASDTITDFSTAQVDKLDVSDILSGYDSLTDLISDFVRITDNGTHSFVSVDADGGANSFTQIAQLSGVINIASGATATELELQAMISNGMLIAA